MPNFSSLNEPDVSVIIPTYNRENMIEKALSSVFDQDYSGCIEIIVVDDHSTDNTVERVKSKYPDVNVISLTNNGGSYVARNQGLMNAKGRYIAFLDSDDFWDKQYIASQVNNLQGRDSISFTVSPIKRWDIKGDKLVVDLQKPNLRKYKSAVHHLLHNTFIATPSAVVFPRKIFNEIGFFDESFIVGADGEFYIRCLQSDYKMIFLSEPLITKCEHNQNQITDLSNLALREKSRMMRIHRAFSETNKYLEGVSIDEVLVNNFEKFSKYYYLNQQYIPWLTLNLTIAKYGRVKRASSNLLNGIYSLVRNNIK